MHTIFVSPKMQKTGFPVLSDPGFSEEGDGKSKTLRFSGTLNRNRQAEGLKEGCYCYASNSLLWGGGAGIKEAIVVASS